MFQGQYSFASRFEEGEGTNPEELIAAAHASCYAMALSNILAEQLAQELIELRRASFASRDMREGVRAFAEKRRARWHGE